MAYFLQQNYKENYAYSESDKATLHTYTFSGRCIMSNKKVSVTVKSNDLFNYHHGTLIQNAFPYLNKEEREWMITGVYNMFNEFIEQENEEE